MMTVIVRMMVRFIVVIMTVMVLLVLRRAMLPLPTVTDALLSASRNFVWSVGGDMRLATSSVMLTFPHTPSPRPVEAELLL